MAHGVPMLTAGDEFERTQLGNNNAYCQDNEISWLNWHMADANADLVRFFRLLIEFRKRCSLLRRSTFNFSGSDGFHVTWHGVKRMQPDWSSDSRTVAMQLTQFNSDGSRHDIHFIANAHWEDHEFELPQIGEYEWFRLIDTSSALAARHRRRRSGIPAALAGELQGEGAQRGGVRGQVRNWDVPARTWGASRKLMRVRTPLACLSQCFNLAFFLACAAIS